jgi:ABC-type antimicrobial peptide transport system permease subunit
MSGMLAGAVMAMWLTRAISGMLYNVKPGDPISFAVAALSLFLVALLGSYLPARAAARVDPMNAMRQE